MEISNVQLVETSCPRRTCRGRRRRSSGIVALVLFVQILICGGASSSAISATTPGASAEESFVGESDGEAGRESYDSNHHLLSKHVQHTESGEDFQYYDDDPGVVFVTEDDTYDEAPAGAGAFPYGSSLASLQGNSARSQKHWSEEGCPPVPEAVSAINVTMCVGMKCIKDYDCSSDGSFICCYNGCIHTCTRRVDPPPAFDWLEETEVRHFNHSSSRDEEEGKIPGSNLMMAEIKPETIALPGGCYLNKEQYEHLKVFRKYQHVKSCSCENGDVVCNINRDMDLEQIQVTSTSV